MIGDEARSLIEWADGVAGDPEPDPAGDPDIGAAGMLAAAQVRATLAVAVNLAEVARALEEIRGVLERLDRRLP